MTSAGRESALDVRLATERGQRLDRAFDAVADRLDDRERRFAHELAWGVTRLRGRLDHLLEPFVRKGLANTDPVVRELLRLGAYQILYMDRVPEFAGVSQTVEQVRRRVGKGPTGFVNAVLRRVAEAGAGEDRWPNPENDPAGFLSAWGSHPLWLVERWLSRMPFTQVLILIEANNRRPETCVTSLDASSEGALAQLERAGIRAEETLWGSSCVKLEWGASVVGALEAAHPAIVQDPAANLVVLYADVPSGTMVADLCAAPGGKALALSSSVGHVFAADRSEARIRMVQNNVERTGVTNVTPVVGDASAPPVAGVDVALLDVPCTGTGTLARHPDARWRLTPESSADLAAVQGRLVRAVADSVKPGGLLIYSTCTLEPEENEDVVRAFLADRTDFVLERGMTARDYVDEEGYLRVWPQESGFDGAFAARMRKAS